MAIMRRTREFYPLENHNKNEIFYDSDTEILTGLLQKFKKIIGAYSSLQGQYIRNSAQPHLGRSLGLKFNDKRGGVILAVGLDRLPHQTGGRFFTS